jgi:hypothetical protein
VHFVAFLCVDIDQLDAMIVNILIRQCASNMLSSILSDLTVMNLQPTNVIS